MTTPLMIESAPLRADAAPRGRRHWMWPLLAILAAPWVVDCGPAKPVEQPLPPASAPPLPSTEPSSQRMGDGGPKPDERGLPRFTLVLPGHRIAKIPIAVVESYVDPEATAAHGARPLDGTPTTKHMDEDADWHNDYEYGECYYDRGLGVTRALAWHRHPFDTEYAELYE